MGIGGTSIPRGVGDASAGTIDPLFPIAFTSIARGTIVQILCPRERIMTLSPVSNRISPGEYLALEEKSSVKHEYRDGEVYERAGASNNHVLITGNLATRLKTHLRGSGCRVFAADTKVRIESANIYYYPDVVVSCDDRDREFPNFLRYPCLIVEVVSESTEAFDRGDKFADYRQLETLREYVLIGQKTKRIDVFGKNEAGQWVLFSYSPGDRLELSSVGFSGSIADIYEDVSLESESRSGE